jgi:urease accessory protein UreH
VERIGNKSELSKLYSNNPIRFMPLARSTTSLPSSAAMDVKYVTTAQFGPGIGGSNPDRSIRVHVKQSSGICLTSATSTKVIRSKASKPCTNVVNGCVEDMGFLFYAPEPLLPSNDSSLSQLQSFELTQNSSIAVLEWISSVRKPSEPDSRVWTLQRLDSVMNIHRDNVTFSEKLLLDNTDHSLDERVRVTEKEALNVVGRFVLYGSQCQESIQKLLNMAERLDTLQVMYNSEEEIVGFSVKNCDPKNIQRHDVFFSLKSFDNNQGLVLYIGGFSRESILNELIEMTDPTLSALLTSKI